MDANASKNMGNLKKYGSMLKDKIDEKEKREKVQEGMKKNHRKYMADGSSVIR